MRASHSEYRQGSSVLTVRPLQDDEPCDACNGLGWGIFTANDAPSGMLFIQRCDACEKYPGDIEAAADSLIPFEIVDRQTGKATVVSENTRWACRVVEPEADSSVCVDVRLQVLVTVQADCFTTMSPTRFKEALCELATERLNLEPGGELVIGYEIVRGTVEGWGPDQFRERT